MFKNSTVLEKQIGWAAATFLLYNLIVGWKIALLIMISVGFHESCHLMAAKKMELRTGGFYFLPFIGGAAIITDKYKRLSQQAFVVLAGPMGGGLLAFLTYSIFLLTGSHYPFLGYSAFCMALLNLFNLLPLSMMDGGQLMNTISYSINRKVGFYLQVVSTIAAIILLWQINPILSIVIGIFGSHALLIEYKNQKNYQDKFWLCTDAYLNLPSPMTAKQMLQVGCCWIGTATGLIYLIIALKKFSPF
jgi:putative peptide zinc metalloprotease protein